MPSGKSISSLLVQNHQVYDVDALQAASVRFLDTRGVTAKGERL